MVVDEEKGEVGSHQLIIIHLVMSVFEVTLQRRADSESGSVRDLSQEEVM